MIAEIHGKISRSGSNLRTTSEDNLTGDVFGALRYVPFNELMKPLILNSIEAVEDSVKAEVIKIVASIKEDYWSDKIDFWPYDQEGELDILLRLPGVTIGIEVKLNSVMSDQEDENQYTSEESHEQLARESRIVKRLAENEKGNAILILLARKQFAKDTVLSAKNIADSVKLCYIGWEDFLDSLKKEAENNEHSKYTLLIISDIIDLLVRKDFEKFRSFDDLECFPQICTTEGFYKFSQIRQTNNFSFCDGTEILEEDYYEFENR